MMSVFEDGRRSSLYRDTEKIVAEIAQFSTKDAEAFRKVSAQAAGWLPMITASLYTPPTPVGAGNAHARSAAMKAASCGASCR